MKKFVWLAGITIMSYTSFSQTLLPKILTEGKDTLFCFTIPQSKHLAKTIIRNDYCDSISVVNSQTIRAQDSIISAQKNLIGTIRSINDNNQGQITNLNILNSTLKMDLRDAQASNKRLKKYRLVYFSAGVLTSATTVYLMK